MTLDKKDHAEMIFTLQENHLNQGEWKCKGEGRISFGQGGVLLGAVWSLGPSSPVPSPDEDSWSRGPRGGGADVAAHQYFPIFPTQDFCNGFRDISSPPEPTLQFIILGGFSEEEERYGAVQ